MNIKRWIRNGNSGLAYCNTEEALLESAGNLLDKAYSHDIVGEVLFEGEDGKMYVGTVEFVIAEANPEYVKDVLAQIKKEDEEWQM